MSAVWKATWAPFVFLALISVAACTTRNPYTGQPQTSNATKGAIIGAAAGAALGLLTGSHNAERALIGAGVGALSGAAVGHYMDEQEAVLRQELRGTGVKVTRVGNKIVLDMPGNVTFKINSAGLRSRFFPVLDSVAKVAKHYKKTVLIVDGFTDSTGTAAYNLRLSRRRARAVASYLVSRGVNQQRIVAHGFGENYPIASNASPRGRAENRRVSLTLEPLTSGSG